MDPIDNTTTATAVAEAPVASAPKTKKPRKNGVVTAAKAAAEAVKPGAALSFGIDKSKADALVKQGRTMNIEAAKEALEAAADQAGMATEEYREFVLAQFSTERCSVRPSAKFNKNPFALVIDGVYQEEHRLALCQILAAEGVPGRFEPGETSAHDLSRWVRSSHQEQGQLAARANRSAIRGSGAMRRA